MSAGPVVGRLAEFAAFGVVAGGAVATGVLLPGRLGDVGGVFATGGVDGVGGGVDVELV